MTDTPPGVPLLTRTAARVLLLDASDRVLLLHGSDPARPGHSYWMTVGGGLDDGETPRQAAARELFEETGLRLPAADLVGPVHHETTTFPFDGRWYEQSQHFFVARVPAWTVDRAGFNEVEVATIDAERWWTVDELVGTVEKVYPENLVDLLRTATGVN